MGADTGPRRKIALDRNWLSYSLNHECPNRDVPAILIERGPKNNAEVKRSVKKFSSCVVLFAEGNSLFLKATEFSRTVALDSDEEYGRMSSVLAASNFASAGSELDAMIAVASAITAIDSATEDFDNRGLFSTHYLRNRMLGDVRRDVKLDAERVLHMAGRGPGDLLEALGWDASDSTHYGDRVTITITDQDDFSIREREGDVAPSYAAVSGLSASKWAILTNGRRWRLYTSRISASSTNYFEVVLNPRNDATAMYLAAMFGAASFEVKDGTSDVDIFFDESRKFAAELEENLAARIMGQDGAFLDIIKGVLDHDMETEFSADELDGAKQTALKIMYRVWFLAYAEARELLPTRDQKYSPISLQSIRSKLDSYESDPDSTTCWGSLLSLFEKIRNGSKKHNLPQYSGALFRNTSSIDGIEVKNKFIAAALHGLLEADGAPMDYSSLGVRHLGHIFESLMEFVARQADTDIMVLEDKSGIRTVKTRKEATYSYKKNDLYLASRGGIATRKMTASYYTPDKIVEFLVRRGLGPVLEEREKLVGRDLALYRKNSSAENLKACMDRLLDIQVLDPTMGSGHFLVEALNQITQWATGVLEAHPDHPLLAEIESDRDTVLGEQEKRGVKINESLLTHDVLLKRKIMKRCIFGVDLNPMAAELAKLSLWLDSFAIGVPLTYMDHHIKHGDSTMGMFLGDLVKKGMHTLDDWMPGAASNSMICDVVASSDITVEQARASEDRHREHVMSLEPAKNVLDALAASKIAPKILPKKGKDEFIRRFGRREGNWPDDLAKAHGTIKDMVSVHKFFHWEVEMMDAFTDSRHGFDLIVGNPPWEKVKLQNDEFFAQHDHAFRSLNSSTKKKRRMKEILRDAAVRDTYENMQAVYGEKAAFYAVYEMQGVGDRDLWKLVLERALGLVAKGGTISMLIPSQVLVNTGAKAIRRALLDRNIVSLYVFENKKKIFPIHSSYRFVLLTVRDEKGPDKFRAGFYLHHLDSLDGAGVGDDKFLDVSKSAILDLSPGSYAISEIDEEKAKILSKILRHRGPGGGLGEGWSSKFVRGFDTTNDADLFREDGKGWQVLKGENIHQYIHDFAAPEFTAEKRPGLEREGRRKAYEKEHLKFFDTFRLVFRNIARSTDMRTAISTIVPPRRFNAHSVYSVLLYRGSKIALDSAYLKKILYMCGVFNSLAFDFAVRSRIQMNLITVIGSIPVPKSPYEGEIAALAARMVVGSSHFEGLAESMRVPNRPLTAGDRIGTAARIDALVAKSYGLTRAEYESIVGSFKAFRKNPDLREQDHVKWDNRNLKEFYGEMADAALRHFEEMS